MIHGIGVDIVQLARIRDALARYGDRFIKRIYSAGEIELCDAADGDGRVLCFAVRFAAKEAAFKAFGHAQSSSDAGSNDDPTDNLSWHDFEVKPDTKGEPMLALSERAAGVSKELGIARIHLSLSNTSVSASAIVVAEK